MKPTRPNNRRDIYRVIDKERERQVKLHGTSTPDNPAIDGSDFVVILTEEVGEVARGVWERHETHELLDEVLQVAALAVAFLEGELTEDKPPICWNCEECKWMKRGFCLTYPESKSPSALHCLTRLNPGG